MKTFAALDPAGQIALEHDILSLVARFNRIVDDTAIMSNEYLEVVITQI